MSKLFDKFKTASITQKCVTVMVLSAILFIVNAWIGCFISQQYAGAIIAQGAVLLATIVGCVLIIVFVES